MKTNISLPSISALLLVLLTSCGGIRRGNDTGLNSPHWSVRMAESELIRNPWLWMADFVTEKKWNYTQGLMGMAMIRVSQAYGDNRYFDYAKGYADSLIDDKGVIWKYDMTNYNIDQVNPGKMMFLLYEKTGNERYGKVIHTLREQISSQPRIPEGGFWHKKIYPNQMWLDGLYMGTPFYAEYALRYGEDEAFEDIINQFLIVARHTYDPATGLYRHAFDDSRMMPWADSITGQAPHAWGRAMGWYSMAIVDVLDFIPSDQAGRDELIRILTGMVDTLITIQDPQTGGWYQVLDRSGDPGNYIETSCTAMFAYSIFKAVRMGYLGEKYLPVAQKAYNGLIDNFVTVDDMGLVTLTRICGVAGLGGDPYRDGSYEYYIGEEIRDNDPKGVGPFILASLEYEMLLK
ncbi:MAG: glycoside hydrolase family 88 protein [Bacteroidales bacterium]|jgi:unsaturated rhamnogalacturonyl hydrolase|nr:glycoside hydrolase family 88 protein [Bacteroidales bacterium]